MRRNFPANGPPLSSSPSLTSPTYWRESRSTPRTSFDTSPATTSLKAYPLSDPTPLSATQKLRGEPASFNNSNTASRFHAPSKLESSPKSNTAVGGGLINGVRIYSGDNGGNVHVSRQSSSSQDEPSSDYSGPNIWPSAEGIHVRLSRESAEQTATLVGRLLGGLDDKFGGLDEDGQEKTSEWTLLRWEILESFLLDERNTAHLDDGDILRRVGTWLRGQVALRAQRGS